MSLFRSRPRLRAVLLVTAAIIASPFIFIAIVARAQSDRR